MSLIMLAISVLKSDIFGLFFKIYSKVMTAFENYLEASMYCDYFSSFRPNWQASSARFLWRMNSSEGVSFFSPSINGKSSSSAKSMVGSTSIVVLFGVSAI